MKIGTRFKNEPYLAFKKEDAVLDKNLNCYVTPVDKVIELWKGRSVAVSAIVAAVDGKDIYFLVNQRGKGTPDYKDKWNFTCGYLEGHESANEGCTREVYEETGIMIDPDKFELVMVQTNPLMCNHGNVTLRYLCVLPYLIDIPDDCCNTESRGGEKGEVSDVKWVNKDNIPKYVWAFDHQSALKYYAYLINENLKNGQHIEDIAKHILVEYN